MVTTFGRSLLSGGSLLSGFTSRLKKLTLISGGATLGGRYYRNFTVIKQETLSSTTKFNFVPRVSHLTAPRGERGETLVGSGHVLL